MKEAGQFYRAQVENVVFDSFSISNKTESRLRLGFMKVHTKKILGFVVGQDATPHWPLPRAVRAYMGSLFNPGQAFERRRSKDTKEKSAAKLEALNSNSSWRWGCSVCIHSGHTHPLGLHQSPGLGN